MILKTIIEANDHSLYLGAKDQLLGCDIDDNEYLVSCFASDLIYEYYEGEELEHSGGFDPATNYDVPVSGKDYIKAQNWTLEEALENAINELRP